MPGSGCADRESRAGTRDVKKQWHQGQRPLNSHYVLPTGTIDNFKCGTLLARWCILRPAAAKKEPGERRRAKRAAVTEKQSSTGGTTDCTNRTRRRSIFIFMP
ncbi:unnamed protein product [Prorocentrum cordatum]|uniref:Uncharacterized protein n=1 Tax=Prorocentrum cordatum TaxID=2364126 RepID=A0ABN9R3D2_9DINO|nr:unnamed protein product [Polarella glacialis]